MFKYSYLMLMLSLLILLSLILALIFLGLGYVLSKKMIMDENKMSPFECGFVPRENSRFSFSLQFFLISMIFIIFDVELILLFPFLSRQIMNSDLYMNLLLFIFLFTLMGGLLLEWNHKMLEWYRFE